MELMYYDAEMLLDVHQHLWTRPLIDRLAARPTLPMVRWTGGLAVLHCAAEQPYVIDVATETAEQRSALVRHDGLDQALIAISSPVGIEALPRESALELIEAHLEGVEALGGEFGVWGPIALDRPQPGDVDRLLERGCIGISVPAGALAGPDALEQLGPVLERASRHLVPLFVHPGRAPGELPEAATFGEPLWWRAMTDYVASMQAAWLTLASGGRREHPDLTVVFAMLAGLAPLHIERLTTRGGPPVDLRDPAIFYESSSYGPGAIAALANHVGEEQLLYGSDRPVVEPAPTGWEARLQANGGRRFASTMVSA
jgi:hypothetical protein